MTTNKTNSKQWVFKTLSVLLPFIILLLVEGVLRVSGYGYHTGLFIEDKTGSFYQLNPDISKKYFTVTENATIGYQEQFSIRKEPGTIRIFVLGASSSIGFPYMHNGAFPRMLKYKLQFEYPDTRFEIINLSLTAVNSYTLYDFAEQLVYYQPDAVLIYAGHNEYYGALGVASTSSIGRNPAWIRFTIRMQEWKLGQWLFRLAASLKGVDKRTVDYSLTLMERMTKEQSVPYQSEMFNQGLEQYRKNMGDIIEIFRTHHIPVVLGTLVSNERDLPPFISSEDDTNADDVFAQANEAYNRGDYETAKALYLKARDYDQLRFRTPGVFNEVISSLADESGNVHLADVLNTLEQHSPHSILGSSLLLEHVHPNLTGQQLIAETYYKVLKETGLVSGGQGDAPVTIVEPDGYPFTPYDTIFGDISVLLLKELWPFNEPLPEEDPAHVKSFEEQIAGACAVKQLNWYESMERLYRYYEQKGDKENALRVMEGICLEFPYVENYWKLAGKLCLQMDEDKKAWFYFHKLYQLSPTSDTASNLVIALLKLDLPEKALPYIDKVIIDKSYPVNFRPMKDIALKVIACKDSLANGWGNEELLKQQISGSYTLIGNTKAAAKYIQP